MISSCLLSLYLSSRQEIKEAHHIDVVTLIRRMKYMVAEGFGDWEDCRRLKMVLGGYIICKLCLAVGGVMIFRLRRPRQTSHYHDPPYFPQEISSEVLQQMKIV